MKSKPLSFNAIFIFSFLFSPLMANGSELDRFLGTHSVTFNEQTTEGELNGCELVYKAIIRDFVYSKGAHYVVFGSIGMHHNANKQLLTSVKVVTSRISFVGSRAEFIPEKPYFGYLRSANGTNNAKSLVSKIDAETEGGVFMVNNFDQSFADIFLEILERNAVTVVFNRAKGRPDVSVSLDLTIADRRPDGSPIRDGQTALRFASCGERLIKSTPAAK